MEQPTELMKLTERLAKRIDCFHVPFSLVTSYAPADLRTAIKFTFTARYQDNFTGEQKVARSVMILDKTGLEDEHGLKSRLLYALSQLGLMVIAGNVKMDGEPLYKE